MELVKELPKELQNKVFYFAAEHPAAALLKRDWFCQFLCKRRLMDHQNPFWINKCNFCKENICDYCCLYGEYMTERAPHANYTGSVRLRCMVMKHEDLCINEMQGWMFSPPWGEVCKRLVKLHADRKLTPFPTFLDTISAPENQEVLEDFLKGWMLQTIRRNEKSRLRRKAVVREHSALRET